MMIAFIALLTVSQRPGPGGDSAGMCATGVEGANLTLACPSGGKITSILFADYGQVTGCCKSSPPNPS